MLNPLPVFFDHSRHQLIIRSVNAHLDVLAFHGQEGLSQPFIYHVEFTSSDADISADSLLGKRASFSLYGAPPGFVMRGFVHPKPTALRTLQGVVSGFKRLSGSNDEARYEITLEPRLALLGRGKQYRIYQQQSVPEIIDGLLRSRHTFEGQDFFFNLVRDYPRREQVMQYDESDLAFIARLLAEVGIWYRFISDDRLNIDVVEFHDDQRHYAERVDLAYRPQSGLASSGQDGVWQLQTHHTVVEQHVNIRAYHYRTASTRLNANIDQTRGAAGTYGEAYHYAEPYKLLGDALDQDEDLLSESGYFYARLRHERYLNGQTQLSGISSSATLAPGQVLKISGGAPQAFAPGAVITQLISRAGRDRSFEVSFQAIPYAETVCFRPPLLARPSIAGTVPARVSSPQANDPYAEIDLEGRYRVHFLFDRDTWKPGLESAWMRLARPYAGDTHGLHLPLIAGTEVAVAFEQGDPDRPYIAHALHDSEHPDHVTLRNYKRNVLRTPANNKLRLEDTRGQEHIKLSTEHSGKSQLNLGHVVDAAKKLRGQGAELRTDGHAALRAGSGMFISADAQPRAQGPMLEMGAAVGRLQQAGEQLGSLSSAAEMANAGPADVQAQLSLLHEQLDQLKASVLLLSAPQGIALTSGKHLQLAAQDNLMLNAGGEADVSVVKRLFIGVGQGLSLFVRTLGIKLIANQGPVRIQAQNDTLHILARHGLEITSSEDEIHITAKQKITLNAGGSYITLNHCGIESGTVGEYRVKSAHYAYLNSKAKLAPRLPRLPEAMDPPLLFNEQYQIFRSDGEQVWAGTRYKISAKSGQVWRGTTDSQGFTQRVHTATPQPLSLIYDFEEEEEEEELTAGITLRLGLFFDGTGNNQSNSAATEHCRIEDLELFEKSELASLIEACSRYGFAKFDGSAFGKTPSDSYGNAPSNVVHLHTLYLDNTATPVMPDTKMAYVKVYLAGIGTNSGEADSVLLGMGMGVGETGVVARVKQAPAAIMEQLREFRLANPETVIRRIEFDIFGFSRGAAAARHCANELLKPDRGLFAELMQKNDDSALHESFDPAVDVCLNLIGLFDTVAAIVNVGRLDFSPANDSNPGVNLYLPANCARQVIHLTARDECRNNFALNSVLDSHQQISLPGVHSDVGGGYLRRGRERVLLTSPLTFRVPRGYPVRTQPEWWQASGRRDVLHDSGLAGDGTLEVITWETLSPGRHERPHDETHYTVSLLLDRPVRSELALISLRVMRELGVRNGVPFEVIDAEDRRFNLPLELQPIADTVLEHALLGVEIKLTPAQDRLLRGRYIHQSAHWVPTKGILADKPAQDSKRNIYPDRPQKGYPE